MISFNTLYDGFELENPDKIKAWLQQLIRNEFQKIEGEIIYVFTDDEFLSKINQDFLNHDTFTDIITFDVAEERGVISGEIYISIDRVKENAQKLQLEFEFELARIIVHGILHLVGYNDKYKEQKLIMSAQEDYCLNLLP